LQKEKDATMFINKMIKLKINKIQTQKKQKIE